MENETREVTYLGVSLMIIAMVIGFIVYGISLTNKMAQARNTEIVANDKIEEYREFNAYDGHTLIGDDVIELIRQKYNSGITIFVDYRQNDSIGEVVDFAENKTCAYCNGKDGDHRLYNTDMYLLHKKAPSENNYFQLAVNAVSAERNDLRNWFPSQSKYRAYLVYNSDSAVKFYEKLMDNYDRVKGGYPATENGKLEALDSGVPPMNPNYRVTGIVLISYTTLGI